MEKRLDILLFILYNEFKLNDMIVENKEESYGKNRLFKNQGNAENLPKLFSDGGSVQKDDWKGSSKRPLLSYS